MDRCVWREGKREGEWGNSVGGPCETVCWRKGPCQSVSARRAGQTVGATSVSGLSVLFGRVLGGVGLAWSRGVATMCERCEVCVVSVRLGITSDSRWTRWRGWVDGIGIEEGLDTYLGMDQTQVRQSETEPPLSLSPRLHGQAVEWIE